MIDANYVPFGASSISAPTFVQTLLAASSPAILERAPVDYYNAVFALRVDPNLPLAIYGHESDYGKKGTAVQTKSWGNTRRPTFGPAPITTPETDIVGRSGTFPAYANWYDGCLSTAARLAAPNYVYLGKNLHDIIYEWAPAGDGNDPAAYLADVIRRMNDAATPGAAKMKRIIVHAGHENIGQIGPEKIGQASADTLRTQTGANGEREWTAATADALTSLLHDRGYDAVRVDAIYRADVYQPDADLCIAIHYDGGAGTGHPQYCMGAAVTSGGSADSADEDANAFVIVWNRLYRAATAYAQGPITDNMTGYYGGWYRTPNTPMCLLEYCLGADASGIRADRPAHETAAALTANAVDGYFGLQMPAPPPPAPDASLHNPVNQFVIGGGFRTFWEGKGGLDLFGYPLENETPRNVGGVRRTTQYFQRARFEYYPENAGTAYEVQLTLLGAQAFAMERN